MMRILEKDVQRELAKYYALLGYSVKREIKTPVGLIDLMLYRDLGLRSYSKVLIEVKEYKQIKSAIGQIIAYRSYHSDVTKSKLIYFCKDGKYKGVDASYYRTCKEHGIEIECVHCILDLSLLSSQSESEEVCLYQV